MAYPNDQSIYVLETVNWTTKFTLRNELISSIYTVCSFSKCGQYIAAGTVKGEISVWNLSKNTVVQGAYKDDQTNPIMSIDWNPLNNGEFAYCDKEGQLGTVINCHGNMSSGMNGKKSVGGSKFIQDEADDDGDGDDDDANDIYGESEINYFALKQIQIHNNNLYF